MNTTQYDQIVELQIVELQSEEVLHLIVELQRESVPSNRVGPDQLIN